MLSFLFAKSAILHPEADLRGVIFKQVLQSSLVFSVSSSIVSFRFISRAETVIVDWRGSAALVVVSKGVLLVEFWDLDGLWQLVVGCIKSILDQVFRLVGVHGGRGHFW